jgi:hypothetical protein
MEGSPPRPGREHVYAIIRWDGFHEPTVPPEDCVTVTTIVRSREAAEAEVARLNALAEGKNMRYWWQTTRLLSN